MSQDENIFWDLHYTDDPCDDVSGEYLEGWIDYAKYCNSLLIRYFK